MGVAFVELPQDLHIEILVSTPWELADAIALLRVSNENAT
jgi:hypothetical protein